MPALKMLDTATPASTRVMRLAPVRSAMSSTSSTPRKAPRKAARGVRVTDWGKRAEHSTTIRPAPELTPMMLGAARGLLRTLWITAPETARAIPASRQPQVRGRRTYWMICPSTEPSSWPSRAWGTRAGERGVEPRQRLSTAESRVSRSSPASTRPAGRNSGVEDVRKLFIGFPPARIRLQIV